MLRFHLTLQHINYFSYVLFFKMFTISNNNLINNKHYTILSWEGNYNNALILFILFQNISFIPFQDKKIYLK